MAEDVRNKSEKSNGNTSAIKNFLAGGVSGVALVAAGYPLDTIKVRLQTQPKAVSNEVVQFTGTLDCARKTIANEGIFGLYKGMATPIFLATPMCAMFFLGFSIGKRLQQKHPNEELSYSQLLKAGVVAGVFGTTVATPAERIKCSLQIQQGSSEKARYTGPVDCARKIFSESGIRGLYKGTGATLLREIPSNAVYFVTYEASMRMFTFNGETRSNVGVLKILTAGGIAGMMFWVPAIVPDTLKSRFQTAPEGNYPNGIRDVFRKIMREDGPRALFKGLTPVMLRAFPANAACFLGYEMAMRFLNWIAPDL